MGLNILLNIVLIIVMLFYSKEKFIDNMWFFYLLHYLFLFGYIISFLRKKFRKIYMLFSPILFSFFYLGISFTLGSYFIPLNRGWSGEVYPNFIIIKHLNLFTIFFFITDLGLLAVWRHVTTKGIKKVKNTGTPSWSKFSINNFVIIAFLFLLLNFFEPLQAILGSSLYSLKLALIGYLVLIVLNLPKKYKILIYLCIVSIMLAQHYHSKREVILVVFIIFFLESFYNDFEININFKTLLKVTGIAAVGVYLVFAASILRGYGGYKLDSKFDAILLVPEYVTSDFIVDAFIVNFELNTVLGNTMICMDFVENDRIPLQFGGTYLKLLFAPIPRSIWEDKPKGMILKYTYTLNPDHERTGNSLPVIHYAEGFANFYWLGIIPIILIMLLFEKMFWYVINCKNKNIFNWKLMFSIYVTCVLFQYIRGSGFDLFSLYALFPLPLIFLISIVPQKKQLYNE